jgi:hypothetical protein
MGLPHFPDYFVVGVGGEDLQHLFTQFFVFALPLHDQHDTVDDFPFYETAVVADLLVEDLEGALRGVVELRR